jgi:peptidoglycan/LPS O-acetylase OafA/YrhL
MTAEQVRHYSFFVTARKGRICAESVESPCNANRAIATKYRPDIDGLRAIAVLWVVGFHAFPSCVRGGFTGVDVFFVISGFLISGIIFNNIDRGTFSLTGFYSRRIKRLFPALLVVLTATYTFGWCALLGHEYMQLGKHIAGGAAFISNFTLWHETDYFDNPAATKPLLHLWSLGVEEQFYVLWPLALWSARRYKVNFLTITLGVAVISFAINIGQTRYDPFAAFYWPLPRFWELMLGALLAYSTFYNQQGAAKLQSKIFARLSLGYRRVAVAVGPELCTVYSLIGLLLITCGVFFLSSKTPFPGWWAMLPTIGTLLIIAAGPEAWINRVILSHPVLVWLGLISYPLYLWHWPLLSFARIVQGSPSLATRSAIVALSVVLAFLTYELVEKPIRFGKPRSVKTLALVISMVAIGYIGLGTYQGDGLKFRSVVKENIDIDSGSDGGWPRFATSCNLIRPEDRELLNCVIDSRAEPTNALLGDSKALALFMGLFRTSVEPDTWMYIGANKNGPLVPVLSNNPIYSDYNKNLVERAIDVISTKQSVHTAVIATATRALFRVEKDDSAEQLPSNENYKAALDGLNRAVTKLISIGKNIVIVIDNPTLPHKEDCIDRRTSLSFINGLIVKPSNPSCHLPIQEYLRLSERYRDLLFEIERKHPESVRIFDATNILCDVQNGVCSIEKNGRLLYSYADHISDYGSTLVGQALNRFVGQESSIPAAIAH